MRVDSTWLGTRCVDFVMAVLLVAGIGKAADADLSTQLIAEWGVFESAGLNTALVLAIISSELTISGGWYLGLRRNAAMAACGMFFWLGSWCSSFSPWEDRRPPAAASGYWRSTTIRRTRWEAR